MVRCRDDHVVAIGQADRQARFDDAALLLGAELKPGSVYRLLADEGARLFDDAYFGDLFARSRLGRPTVAARVVATVMLLQGYEGLSDREACDRLAFDLRWKARLRVCPVTGRTFTQQCTVTVSARRSRSATV
jgi:hypothetical protein